MRYIGLLLLGIVCLAPLYGQTAVSLWRNTQTAMDDHAWSRALDLAHQALDACSDGGTDSLVIDIRLALGEIYQQLGEHDAAIRETRNATLEQQGEVTDRQRLAAYYNLGEFLQAKGMYSGSSEYFKHASELALGFNDLSKVADIYYKLGENSILSGHYDNAIEYCYKSVDLFRELNDNTHLAQVYNNLSTVYRKLGRYDQAIDFLTKAQILNVNSQNWAQVGDNYYNLGQIYIDRLHLSTAQQYFNRAIRIFEDTGNHHGLALCHLAMAQAACDNDQLDEAASHADAAMRIVQERSDASLTPRVHMMQGRIQLKRGDFPAAQASLEQALSSARSLSANEDLLSIYLTLSDIHEREEAYHLSLDYFKAYDSLKDSLHSDNAQQKVAEMQTVYEYFEKEKEVDQLRSRLMIEQMNREKERVEHESSLAIQQLQAKTERSELESRLRIEQVTSEQRKLLLENEQMTSQKQRLELQNAEIRSHHQRLQLLLSVAGLVTLGGFAFILAQRYRRERILRSKIDSQKRELEAAYMQLKDAQRQKIELEQIRSVMAMSVTMNHEINQPLMIIQGNLEMLGHMLEDSGASSRYLERIQSSVERISHLLDNIRSMEDVRIGHYGGGSDMVRLTGEDKIDEEYRRGADLDVDDLHRIREILGKIDAQ